MCGCGTRPPGRPSALPSRPAPARAGACPARPSARTASSWPPPTPTAPYGCGRCRFSPIRTQRSVPMSDHRQKRIGRVTPRVNRGPAPADDTCRRPPGSSPPAASPPRGSPSPCPRSRWAGVRRHKPESTSAPGAGTLTVASSPVLTSDSRSGPRWLMALAACNAAGMLGAFDAGIG